MRVGLITDAYPPDIGGVQIFAAQYAHELAASDEVDRVDVLAFSRPADDHGPSPRVERSQASSTPARLLQGLSWVRRQRFDVVHALSLYPAGLVVAASDSLDPSIASFVTVYGLDSISVVDHPIHHRLRRFIFKGVDDVLFFSDSTREKTHDGYPDAFRSRTIYPGVPTFGHAGDGTDTSYDLENRSDDFIVLTVARLVERKGIRYLIEAVAELPAVSLWVVGAGPEQEALEELARDRCRDGQVTFFGEVSHSALPQFYQRSDLFCLPSIYLREAGDIEGLGLVFLEAQQFGLPVIGTTSGGVPEAIADGESGYLVPERSADAIRDRIAELVDDPEKLTKLSKGARRFVERKFSWEQCINNHLATYREYL